MPRLTVSLPLSPQLSNCPQQRTYEESLRRLRRDLGSDKPQFGLAIDGLKNFTGYLIVNLRSACQVDGIADHDINSCCREPQAALGNERPDIDGMHRALEIAPLALQPLSVFGTDL